MPYTIDFESDAWQDLKLLRKGEQVKILKAIETHLSYDPTRQSKSRIKKLRLGSQPPYRLRVDEFRVFYDVEQEEQKVIIYGVVYKEHALDWLADFAQKRGNL
ncbi:MAG: type II toxin-antitoxin system RelE/ParE family toxin [Anaerolineae bacterium]|nr:type II toxin-antitoxin system RelE/ParE family toxin [Anaerolineae bacterium]